jgi:hypothetical protein
LLSAQVLSELVTRRSNAARVLVLAPFWIVFLLGAYATAFDLLRGRADWWMLFLPMWGVVTGLVTYAAWSDWNKERGKSKSAE